MISILLVILATFRIANLITKEEGPFHVFAGIRKLAKRSQFTDELFTCFKCCSIWVAFPFAVYVGQEHWLVMTCAISAGAMILKCLFDWFVASADVQTYIAGAHQHAQTVSGNDH